MRWGTYRQFGNFYSHGPPTSGCLLPDHNVFPPWQRIRSIWLFPCCPYKWFVGHPPFCHWCLVYVPLYLQYPYYWQQNHMMRAWSPCNSQTAPSSPPPHCDNCILCLCSQIWFFCLNREILIFISLLTDHLNYYCRQAPRNIISVACISYQEPHI